MSLFYHTSAILKKSLKDNRIVTLLFLCVSGPRLALARLLSGKQAVYLLV